MAVTSGFFNSVNGDRVYNAAQFGQIFDGLITDGVYTAYGDGLKVTPNDTGLKVNVGSGRAWFDSTWTYNDSTIVFELQGADTMLNRIDAIVLDIDTSTNVRRNDIIVKTGIPTTTPSKPTMERSATHNQYALAYVTVPAMASTITDTDIEDVRGTEETPVCEAILELSSQTVDRIDDKITELEEEISHSGTGDMLKRDYDTNNDGKVDKAEVADSLASTLPVNKGGTGATTASAARSNLGITDPPSLGNFSFSSSGVASVSSYVMKLATRVSNNYAEIGSTGDPYIGLIAYNGSTAGSFTLKLSNSSGVNHIRMYNSQFEIRTDKRMGLYAQDNNDYLYLRGDEGLEMQKTNGYTAAPIKASAFNTSSSLRYKKDIENMTEEDAKKLLSLRPVTFKYKDDLDENICKGLIAEEALLIDEFQITYDPRDVDEYGNKIPDSIDYSKYIAQLIKLVQIQQNEINDLKERVQRLEER